MIIDMTVSKAVQRRGSLNARIAVHTVPTSAERVSGMPRLVTCARCRVTVRAVEPHVDATHLVLASQTLFAHVPVYFAGPGAHAS